MSVEGLQSAVDPGTRRIAGRNAPPVGCCRCEGAPTGSFTVIFDQGSPPHATRVHRLSPLGPGGPRSLGAPSGRAFASMVEEWGGLYQVYLRR